MKQIAKITFCFVVLLGIQVFISTWISNSDKDNRVFTEVRHPGVILEDCWNNVFADDNEVEIKNPIKVLLIGDQTTINLALDIFSRPVKPSLLSPLFVDRPPPAAC